MGPLSTQPLYRSSSELPLTGPFPSDRMSPQQFPKPPTGAEYSPHLPPKDGAGGKVNSSRFIGPIHLSVINYAAQASRDALQTLLECPWATKGQWKIFLEGKLAPTDPPSTAQKCLQTIRLLAGQITAYTGGSATAGTKDGGAGVIATCGDPADPTILRRSHLHGAAFTSSFAEEAAVMQRTLE